MPLWDHDSACSMYGEVLDRWEDHALSSCCGGDRVLRHSAIRNVVCSAVAEFTLVSPQVEKPGLLLPRGCPILGVPTPILTPPFFPLLRPPLVAALPTWVPRSVSGFAEAWDLSVSSLLRSSHLSSASPSVADVFREVETRKRAFQDTASLVAERGATFLPTCLGGSREWVVPSAFGASWLGSLPSPARPAAWPLTCPRTPASGLHSASAAPFTEKTRVQS